MVFSVDRFVKIAAAFAAVVFVEFALMLTDSAVAVRSFGSDALGALMLVLPFFTFATVVFVLQSAVASSMYGRAALKGDKALKSRIVRLGLAASVATGLAFLGVATLMEIPYVDFFSPNREVYRLFDEFWNWFSFAVLVESVTCFALFLVYADGGRRYCVASVAVQLLANPFLALAFANGFCFVGPQGMEGIPLGTSIAQIAGFAVLMLYLRDRKRCGIEFFPHEVPAAKPPRPPKKSYEVLRGSQLSLEELEEVIELDRQNYDACYQVEARDDYELFKSNAENGLVIRDRDTKKIVGYTMLLPVRDDLYNRIKTGTFIDTELTPEMTFKYDRPGIYHLYFASIVIHPDHRSAALLLTMLDAMVEDFISLAKDRDIWFSDMIADETSASGVKFARFFGLKQVCESNHNSFIYEVKGLPPEIRVTTPSTKRLVDLYRSKYESL